MPGATTADATRARVGEPVTTRPSRRRPALTWPAGGLEERGGQRRDIDGRDGHRTQGVDGEAGGRARAGPRGRTRWHCAGVRRAGRRSGRAATAPRSCRTHATRIGDPHSAKYPARDPTPQHRAVERGPDRREGRGDAPGDVTDGGPQPGCAAGAPVEGQPDDGRRPRSRSRPATCRGTSPTATRGGPATTRTRPSRAVGARRRRPRPRRGSRYLGPHRRARAASRRARRRSARPRPAGSARSRPDVQPMTRSASLKHPRQPGHARPARTSPRCGPSPPRGSHCVGTQSPGGEGADAARGGAATTRRGTRGRTGGGSRCRS